MKFGCCIGLEPARAAILREVGFDFAETDVKNMMKLDDEQFAVLAESFRETGLPIESACLYLADGMALDRLHADYDTIRAYVNKAAARCHTLGVQTIVFGSGGSRRRPAELTEQEMFEDLVLFLKDYAVPSVAPYGIHIVIEPLASCFCDTIHTVPEAIALADAVNSEWVKVLADNYHMSFENEEETSVAAYTGKLYHVHTSCPSGGKGRTVPMHGDGYDQKPFLRAAAATGCPRISIEADLNNETFAAQVADAITVLREAVEA